MNGTCRIQTFYGRDQSESGWRQSEGVPKVGGPQVDGITEGGRAALKRTGEFGRSNGSAVPTLMGIRSTVWEFTLVAFGHFSLTGWLRSYFRSSFSPFYALIDFPTLLGKLFL